MAANGRLPSSELAPISGGFKLSREAAAAFNAMDAEAVRRFRRHAGVRDAYRVLGSPGDLARGKWSQWAAWERFKAGGNLAASPGTSNHGLGLAVDLTSEGIWVVNQIGARYGWAKRWSDAPNEAWHFKYRSGVWDGKVVGRDREKLNVLTPKERAWVEKRYFHRAGMAHEAKTGKGPIYKRHLKWARHYRAKIRAQMRALRRDARAAGGWAEDNRGQRYQVLKAAYDHKLDL